MESKKQFNSMQDILDFLRGARKQDEATRRKSDKEFEKERKEWEAKDRAFDLDEEKKKHEAYLKGIKRLIGEQKILVENVERIMRYAGKRNKSKDKRYNRVAVETKTLASEPTVTYKNKRK